MSEAFLFSFMENEHRELATLAAEVEARLFSDPHAVLMKGRLFAEQLAKKVTANEKLEEVYEYKQVERIHKLQREGIMTETVAAKFEWLRKAGNKAAHKPQYGTVQEALHTHRHMYDIAVWYEELYGNVNFQAAPYRIPTAQAGSALNQAELEEIISETLKETIETSIADKFAALEQALQALQQMSSGAASATPAALVDHENATSAPSAAPVDREGATVTRTATATATTLANRQWAASAVSDTLAAQDEAANETAATSAAQQGGARVTPTTVTPTRKLQTDDYQDKQTQAAQLRDSNRDEAAADGTFPLLNYLAEHALEVIDKRASGGTIWIVGGWELNEVLFPLKAHNIYFRFTKKGSQSTKRRPAWFLLGKYPPRQNTSATDGEASAGTAQERQPQRIKMPLITYLQKQGCEVIDKRLGGGAIWVVGGWELNKLLFPLKEQHIYFRFVKKGSQSTKKRPAWFLLGKHAPEAELLMEVTDGEG